VPEVLGAVHPLTQHPLAAEDVDGVLQAVRFELYRDNVLGALEVAERAARAHADPRYADEVARIRAWLRHLDDHAAYTEVHERQYRALRWKPGLKRLEKQIRMLLGRKTRKMIERRSASDEFRELEADVRTLAARRILEVGSGEGGVSMALASRHPTARIEAVEVAATNVRIARRLNRFPNLTVHQGLAEEVDRLFPADAFDLVFSFHMMEHVPDVDVTIAALARVLRAGGRCCFSVPMLELSVRGPIPEFVPEGGFAGHCRAFSEADLRWRFGHHPAFRVVKLPGVSRPGRLPECFEVREVGSLYVSWATL
jgi:2-polyprenyl-3-methyl-5-hydroxy-6-metoxy-1,4-benzoquinol methylase